MSTTKCPTASAILPQTAGLTRWLTAPRFRIVLLQSLVGIILSCQLRFGEHFLIGPGTADLLALGLLVMVAGLLALPPNLLEARWFSWSLVGCNTTVVTAVIYLSGSARSELYLSYFLLMLIAASVRTLKQMLGLSVVLCAAYGAVLYEGVIETGQVSAGHLLGVPVLLIMAVFYGVTLESLSEERDQKASLLGEIAELREMEAALRAGRDQLEARMKGLRAELSTVNETLRLGAVERTGLQRQLRDAQKLEAIGRIAGGLAQEFDHVLSVIGGRTGFLLSKLKLNDPLRRPVEEVFNAGDRAAELTAQILSLGQSESVSRDFLPVNVIVTELQDIVQELLPSTVECRLVLAPDAGSVRADRGQIEEILLRLALNAREVMPRGGRLSIETKNMTVEPSGAWQPEAIRGGRAVALVVSDNGSGMNQETRAGLCEPFISATSIKGKGASRGLRLVTIYALAGRNGGFVEVHSSPGQGTVVTVYLPQAEREAPPSGAGSYRALCAKGAETILLVEEDEVLRTLARATLSRYQYHVLVAGSPVEAMLVGQQHTGAVHVAVTNLIMPDLGGRDLVQRLMVQHPSLKALFISGYAEETMNHHRIDRKRYLRKPYAQSALVEKVREVLDA
ncbi:MAG: response regulator [Nitrospirota bacterium]